jgi:hypothetical protein
LARIKMFEDLLPFVAMFDEEAEATLPRRRGVKVKYDYDWRVVVANSRENVYG